MHPDHTPEQPLASTRRKRDTPVTRPLRSRDTQALSLGGTRVMESFPRMPATFFRTPSASPAVARTSRARRRRSDRKLRPTEARGGGLKFVLISVALAFAAALHAPPFAAALEAGTAYRVQTGDTLSAIARATGIPLPRLAALNNLTNPDLIIAGQELRLEPGESVARPATATNPSGPTYVVQPGDTLWGIASRARVPVDTLATLNGLTDRERLAVGQRLKMPDGVQVSAQVAAVPATRVPTSAPPAAPGLTLEHRILAEARRVAGPNVRVGVAARNLATDARVAIRADEPFPSASVMKLPILVELERQIAAGKLSWTESLRLQASSMMSISDNEAANRLHDLVGEANVNGTMAKLGLPNTRLVNHFADTRSPRDPGQNTTTPADMARLLGLVAEGELVSAPVSADIRSLLERSSDRSKLARLLPADTRVAHKSGWYQGVANDVGLVTTGRGARWVIAVFTEGVADAETGNQTVAAISRAVYDAWGS